MYICIYIHFLFICCPLNKHLDKQQATQHTNNDNVTSNDNHNNISYDTNSNTNNDSNNDNTYNDNNHTITLVVLLIVVTFITIGPSILQSENCVNF